MRLAEGQTFFLGVLGTGIADMVAVNRTDSERAFRLPLVLGHRIVQILSFGALLPLRRDIAESFLFRRYFVTLILPPLRASASRFIRLLLQFIVASAFLAALLFFFAAIVLLFSFLAIHDHILNRALVRWLDVVALLLLRFLATAILLRMFAVVLHLCDAPSTDNATGGVVQMDVKMLATEAGTSTAQ
jgi:hypothetical protein